MTDLSREEEILIERIRRSRRLQEFDAPEVVFQMEAKLVAKALAGLLGPGWSDDALAVHEKDLAAAAGECTVPIPEPGSHLAKLLRANVRLRNEKQVILDRASYLLQTQNDPLYDEPETDEETAPFPTIRERLGDDLFCERAYRFITGKFPLEV